MSETVMSQRQEQGKYLPFPPGFPASYKLRYTSHARWRVKSGVSQVKAIPVAMQNVLILLPLPEKALYAPLFPTLRHLDVQKKSSQQNVHLSSIFIDPLGTRASI